MSRWWIAASFGLGLAGCPGDGDDNKDSGTEPTEDTGTGPTGPTDPDADKDGFPASTDCNDSDAAINPAAVETCDGIDNNCDKGVDDVAAATVAGTNYATVDEAIAAAAVGTVEVCPGEWSITSVVLATGSLSLHGSLGRDVTSLSPAKGGALFEADGDSVLAVSGLSLGGSSDTALVVLGGGSLIVDDCLISGNGRAISAFGDTAGQTPAVVVMNSEISDNHNKDDGGGIVLDLGVSATIDGTTISGNSAARGGGLFASAFFVPMSLTVTNTVFTENSATDGGAVYLSNVALEGDNVQITANTASDRGGGLAIAESSVSGALVSGNDATLGGGVAVLYDALLIGNPIDPDLTSVIIDDNEAVQGGGACVADLTTLTLDKNSAVTLNTASEVGGGAWLDGPASVVWSLGADWGSALAGNDNAPNDLSGPGKAYALYDGPSLFYCLGTGTCYDTKP